MQHASLRDHAAPFFPTSTNSGFKKGVPAVAGRSEADIADSDMCSERMLSLLLTVLATSPAFALSWPLPAVGQSCKMESGAEGVCQPAFDCPSAMESLQKNGVYPITCGFQGRQPIVCCGRRTGNSLPGTAAPATLSPRGRKSEEACRAYSNELPVVVNPTVLNGDLVSQRDMPHMATLGFTPTKASSVSWDCGGSLISDRYVLTAAHCFRRRGWRLEKVRLGGVDLTSSSEGAEEVSVEQVISHPDYRPPYNDIALIRLARAVKFSENLSPACIYSRPELSGDVLVVAGWGATDPLGDNKSKYLLSAVVQDMEQSRCNGLHKGNPMLRSGVVDSMICAYDPQGKSDTCSGDSGGPLQTLTEDASNVYSIIGITSIGSAVCAGSTPAIYTKVSSYVPWIESIVWP